MTHLKTGTVVVLRERDILGAKDFPDSIVSRAMAQCSTTFILCLFFLWLGHNTETAGYV